MPRSATRGGGGSPGRLAVVLGPAVALLSAAALLALDGQTGVSTLLELRSATAEARVRVAALAAERAELRALVRRLHRDPQELEAVARERLGMLRPGEVVVRFR